VAEAFAQERNAAALDGGLHLHHDVVAGVEVLALRLEALDGDDRDAGLLGKLRLAPAEERACGANLQVGDQVR
jgi:hypothetical protein